MTDTTTPAGRWRFGRTSLMRLATCHPDLRLLMQAALADSPVDFGIVCGHRGKADQDEAVRLGRSKTPWPTSKHNKLPSLAVDVCPWIDGAYAWSDIPAFRAVAAHVIATARELGIRIRWGGDFNGNGLQDDRFVDMPHFELVQR